MGQLKKGIVLGLLFLAGILSFISDQFIFSTVLFASAAVYSNIAKNARLDDHRQA